MKTSIYITGILSTNLILAGTLFKIMHWPGANIMFTLGCMCVCFVFLPSALIHSYREIQRNLALHIVTYLVFTLGVLSILFKVMHWVGSGILLQVAFPLPFMLFLPVYIYQTRKDPKFNDTQFLGILFGLTFIAVFSILLGMQPA